MARKFLAGLLILFTVNSHAASWECVSRVASCNTWRMWVPAGWIVSGDTLTSDHTYAMTFVPDQSHIWSI
jgi:hypothetical protein